MRLDGFGYARLAARSRAFFLRGGCEVSGGGAADGCASSFSWNPNLTSQETQPDANPLPNPYSQPAI